MKEASKDQWEMLTFFGRSKMKTDFLTNEIWYGQDPLIMKWTKADWPSQIQFLFFLTSQKVLFSPVYVDLIADQNCKARQPDGMWKRFIVREVKSILMNTGTGRTVREKVAVQYRRDTLWDSILLHKLAHDSAHRRQRRLYITAARPCHDKQISTDCTLVHKLSKSRAIRAW